MVIAAESTVAMYSECCCTSVIGQVSGVMLMCGPVGVINQCNASWNVSL